jgi:hypothetical protein
VLPVRSDEVEVHIRLIVVPPEHHADARRRLRRIRLVELDALLLLAVRAAHLDAVGADAKCVRPREASVFADIQRHRVAVDDQAMRAIVVDRGEAAADQRAVLLRAAIDR